MRAFRVRRLRASGSYSLCRQGVAGWTCSVSAWQEVRRNGRVGRGGRGGDRRTSSRRGWTGGVGELARDLKEGTYRPNAVRQVLIPKKQRGKFRPGGHSVCAGSGQRRRRRMLVLSPIGLKPIWPRNNGCLSVRAGARAMPSSHVHRLAEPGPPRAGGRRPDGLLRPDPSMPN